MVRLRLDEHTRPGSRPDDAIPGLVQELPHPPRLFVERWLDSQSTVLFGKNLLVPVIGAGLLFVVCVFLAIWQFSDVIANPPQQAQSTVPSIRQAQQKTPSINQLYPAPGTNTTGTQAIPSRPQGSGSSY
jgi:hypothetical protein